jgi:hypothetical protein
VPILTRSAGAEAELMKAAGATHRRRADPGHQAPNNVRGVHRPAGTKPISVFLSAAAGSMEEAPTSLWQPAHVAAVVGEQIEHAVTNQHLQHPLGSGASSAIGPPVLSSYNSKALISYAPPFWASRAPTPDNCGLTEIS